MNSETAALVLCLVCSLLASTPHGSSTRDPYNNQNFDDDNDRWIWGYVSVDPHKEPNNKEGNVWGYLDSNNGHSKTSIVVMPFTATQPGLYRNEYPLISCIYPPVVHRPPFTNSHSSLGNIRYPLYNARPPFVTPQVKTSFYNTHSIDFNPHPSFGQIPHVNFQIQPSKVDVTHHLKPHHSVVEKNHYWGYKTVPTVVENQSFNMKGPLLPTPKAFTRIPPSGHGNLHFANGRSSFENHYWGFKTVPTFAEKTQRPITKTRPSDDMKQQFMEDSSTFEPPSSSTGNNGFPNIESVLAKIFENPPQSSSMESQTFTHDNGTSSIDTMHELVDTPAIETKLPPSPIESKSSSDNKNPLSIEALSQFFDIPQSLPSESQTSSNNNTTLATESQSQFLEIISQIFESQSPSAPAQSSTNNSEIPEIDDASSEFFFETHSPSSSLASQSSTTEGQTSQTLPQLAGKLFEDTPCDRKLGEMPDFTAPWRRVSEKKCYEYIWQLKAREEKRLNDEACKKYQRDHLPFTLHIAAVGGRDALPGEFPHMGAIAWKAAEGGWIFKCGSSLISPKFVVTAAHCSKASSRDPSIADPVPKMIRFGDKNIIAECSNGLYPTDANIKKIIVHPDYKSPKKYNDIALMELDHELKFNYNVQPACLWKSLDTRPLGNRATLTGWGVVKPGLEISPLLQAAEVEIIDSKTCDGLLRPYCSRVWCGIQNTQICAGNLTGGVDACQGDSGGPLQVKIPLPVTEEGSMHYLIGIISFGFKCAQPDFPGVYTRISPFLDWIESHVWPGETK